MCLFHLFVPLIIRLVMRQYLREAEMSAQAFSVRSARPPVNPGRLTQLSAPRYILCHKVQLTRQLRDDEMHTSCAVNVEVVRYDDDL